MRKIPAHDHKASPQGSTMAKKQASIQGVFFPKQTFDKEVRGLSLFHITKQIKFMYCTINTGVTSEVNAIQPCHTEA